MASRSETPPVALSALTPLPFPSLDKTQQLDVYLEQFLDPIHGMDNNSSSNNGIDNSKTEQQLDARHVKVLRVAHFLFGNMLLSALEVLQDQMITRVYSIPSKRQCFLVKCKKSNSSRKNNHNHNNDESTSNSYFCILPAISPRTHQKDHHHHDIQYCSCRSFLENSKASSAPKQFLCKHLLALKLMPALQHPYNIIETVSDDAFSTFVLSRIC